MHRVEHALRQAASRPGGALVPFVCAGYPSLDDTARALTALQDAGAAAIEVGFPFSDPIADGPLIAQAMHEALRSGVTPQAVCDVVGASRARINVPIIAMVSISLASKGGLDRFVARLRKSGFDGLIVPDLPIDEADELRALAREADLALPFLVAPTSTPQRVQRLAEASTGFVYLLARTGITGYSTDCPNLRPRVAEARRHTTIPIAVGFGISTPAHVGQVVAQADAAIVGSALVRAMRTAHEAGQDPVAAAASLCRSLVGLP